MALREYIVVTESTSNALGHLVTEHMRDGWMCVGGVAFAAHPWHDKMDMFFLFAQAMRRVTP